MSCRYLCVGVVASLFLAIVGCGDSAPDPRSRRDAAPDLAIARDGAGGGVADARAPDSALTDSAAFDSSVADSAVADSRVAQPDSAAADGPIADQAVADSAVPDAPIIADAAVDAPAPDASPDQAVSPPDTGPDAPSFCRGTAVTCGCQARSRRSGKYVNLWGKAKPITGGFPDFLVKTVTVGEDLRQQFLTSVPNFPKNCGEWHNDESHDFPDFTYRVVMVGEDFEILEVPTTTNPGLPFCAGTCP